MNSRKSVRAKFAASLSLGLAFVVQAAWTSEAQAQLRTGRQSSREYYSASPAATPEDAVVENDVEEEVAPVSYSDAKRKRTATPTSTKSKTVQASATTSRTASNSDERRPVRVKPTAAVRTATQSKVHDQSKVVKASCPDCEKGINHTHAPIYRESAPIHDEVVEGDDGSCETCASTCMPSCSIESGRDVNICIPAPFSGALSRFSIRVEAATFWPDGQNIPALVRTGEIGTNGTSDLFGGKTELNSAAQGLRGEFGTFFHKDACSGVMFRFFDANAESLTYNSQAANTPTVVRPYLDPETNTQQSISINEAGVSTGGVLAHATSDVYGGDILFRQLMSKSRFGRSEILVGYQHARLADSIVVDSVTSATNTLQLHDRFTTDNRFNGGVLGLSGISYARQWSLSGMFKMGFGNMDRSVVIDGSQIITVPGNPPSISSSHNGLLARSTNNGSYNFDTFVVTPELNVTLGYRLTRNLEASVGYSYLKLPKVARAGDQIDPNLAANLSDPLTGAANPSFSLHQSNFSLQSLNYGLQYRY